MKDEHDITLLSTHPDHIGEVTEMVGDTISRAKAIEVMRKAKDKSELHRMLVQLPSAQPGWIPCSKKLPEPNRSVLVQLSDDFADPIQIMTFNISKCEGDFFYFWKTQEMSINFDMDDIVAWMPLPQKWKGGQDE